MCFEVDRIVGDNLRDTVLLAIKKEVGTYVISWSQRIKKCVFSTVFRKEHSPPASHYSPERERAM